MRGVVANGSTASVHECGREPGAWARCVPDAPAVAGLQDANYDARRVRGRNRGGKGRVSLVSLRARDAPARPGRVQGRQRPAVRPRAARELDMAPRTLDARIWSLGRGAE